MAVDTDTPLRLHVDRRCGLVEVHVAGAAAEAGALHVAYFLDRAVEARWGAEPADAGPEAKRQALDRLRATPGWGDDAPEGACEDERRTLERLVATPLWESAARLAALLAAEALHSDGWRPRRIVELGAGLGVPGFLAARLWPEANVAVTECGEALVELLRRNLRANFPRGTAAKRPRPGRAVLAFDLAFGGAAAEAALAGPLRELGGPAELVIVSDCFFYPWYGDTWTPLRASLLQLCGDTTLVLLGTKVRGGGRVAEALRFVSQPPFHRRRLLQWGGKCGVCQGEGSIDFRVCWECEGADLAQEEVEEVWLLSRSEAALGSWRSGAT